MRPTVLVVAAAIAGILLFLLATASANSRHGAASGASRQTGKSSGYLFSSGAVGASGEGEAINGETLAGCEVAKSHDNCLFAACGAITRSPYSETAASCHQRAKITIGSTSENHRRRGIRNRSP